MKEMATSEKDSKSPPPVSQGDECYLGVDLFKYEKNRKTYSASLLCGGKLIAKYDDIGLERIIRLCWEWNVVRLAVDNIMELAESKIELGKLVSLLPERTEIYQVNLSENQLKDFRGMLRDLGIYAGQLTPSRTAYYLSLLASKGVGEEAIKKEARTKIIVRKNRNLNAGGMSSNRYRRKVRTAVLQIVNDIKESLDSNGFDYELLYRKSGGGLDGATFTVFAPRESLEGIIRPKIGTSVSIEIKPEYKIKLRLEEKSRSAKPLIVGIDPGMTYGIAVLDINGRSVYSGSWQRIGTSEVIEMIEKLGKPIVVATDVFPVPENVKKIASKFGAEIYSPDRVLTVEEKRAISEEAKKRGELPDYDAHVRDAYAAAYMAYRAFSKKLEEVNTYLQKTGLNLSPERIKKKIIEGKSLAESVEEELREYLESAKQSIKLVLSGESRKEEDKTGREAVEALRKENMLLIKKIESLERELARKEKELELYKKNVLQLDREDYFTRELHRIKAALAEAERMLREKEKAVEVLQVEYNELYRNVERVLQGEMTIAYCIPSLTKSNIGGIPYAKGRLVFLENPDSYQSEAVEELAEKDIAAVLIHGPVSRKGLASLLESKGIPLLSIEGFESHRYGDILFVSALIYDEARKMRENLRKALEEKERARIFSMIEKYKEERLKASSKKML